MENNWEYCPLCKHKLEKFTSEQQIFEAIKEVSKDVDEVFNSEDVEIIGNQINLSIKDKEDIIYINQNKLKFITGLKENIIKDIGANNFAISSLKADIEKTEKKLESLKNIDLSEYEESLQEKRDVLQGHQDRLNYLKTIQPPTLSAVDISKKIQELKLKIQEYNQIEEINRGVIKRNEEKKQKKQELEEEIKQLAEKQVETIKQKNLYEEAFKIFDKNLPNIMTINACATLQNNINDFIQKTFSNYEVVLQASKKGCEFFYTKNASITETKKKNNYLLNSKMSSGFEKDILTLSFKVSLAELYHCNCMILDEADGASDEDNAMLLYDTLMNRFDQIILTTHKNSIKEYLQNNYNAKFITFNNGELQD